MNSSTWHFPNRRCGKRDQITYSDERIAGGEGEHGDKKRRKVPPMDEFATYDMQWAYSDKTEIGEQKLFYRNENWVLLEKTNDGFIELGTYSEKHRNIVSKEIKAYNEELYEQRNGQRGKVEAIRESVMLYETDGRNDTRYSSDVGRQLNSDERAGSLYQGESYSDRSTSDESGKRDNRGEVESKYSSPEEAKASGKVSDAKFSIEFADDIANKQRQFAANGLSRISSEELEKAIGDTAHMVNEMKPYYAINL